MLGKIAKYMAIIGAIMFFGAMYVPMIIEFVKWAPTVNGIGDLWSRYADEWSKHPYFQTWWHGLFVLVLSMMLGAMSVAIKQKKKAERGEEEEDKDEQ